MRYLLLSVLVVCVIGIMIPSAFGVGESIIKEKDCEIIGKELDPNIECRLVIKNWDAVMGLPDVYFEQNGHQMTMSSLMGYDSDNDLMYFGYYKIEQKLHYLIVEMDNFTVVDHVECDAVTTGTYIEKTTYSCALTEDYVRDVLDLGSTSNDHNRAVQLKTTIPYEYSVQGDLFVKSCEKLVVENANYWTETSEHLPACYAKDGFTASKSIHTYNTDLKPDRAAHSQQFKIFLNEDRNELYYFVCGWEQGVWTCVIYLINGMGELKSAAAASEPEPTQSSDGCGEGTELVNGVCQLTKTSGTSQEDGFGVSNLVPIIIPIIGIVSIIALVKSRKKKSSITQPTPEKTKPKPKQKPKPTKQKHVEKEETSSSCSNCGNTLNPKAKFCGGCGSKQ
jgi:hypothetical protein